MTEETSNWEKISNLQEVFEENQYPSVSVIVPTFNSAQKIGITLESLIHQDYPDFEILVIDAGSKDRTVEMVNSYKDSRIRLCIVNSHNRYEMINKGISISRSLYLNIQFPGDYYIHSRTLRSIMGFAIKKGTPSLIYCGSLLREAQKDVKILYRPLELLLIKRGQQPSSLQSFWIKNTTFKEIGKFNPRYSLRGGFDFFCRFLLKENLSFASTKRILTDYDLRGVTRKMMMTHFLETFQILFKYFGWMTTLRWLMHQRDLMRYFHLWWRGVKVAVKGWVRI